MLCWASTWGPGQWVCFQRDRWSPSTAAAGWPRAQGSEPAVSQFGKKKGKTTTKAELGGAMKETDNISDQNSRPKLFCLIPFQTSCWKKKKNQTKSNTSALNVNSTPALRKLLGYVLKVGYALLWASLPHCLLFQRRNLALKKERKEETKKRKKNPWLSEVHASIYRSVWVCTRFPSQQKSSEQRCHNIYQCSKKYHFWKKNIPLVLPFLD